MVVSFVNAEILTLKQAIAVIFGANIGTTVTAWIVSIFGFNFSIASIAIPLFGIGYILKYFKHLKIHNFADSFHGVCTSFYGAWTFKRSAFFKPGFYRIFVKNFIIGQAGNPYRSFIWSFHNRFDSFIFRNDGDSSYDGGKRFTELGIERGACLGKQHRFYNRCSYVEFWSIDQFKKNCACPCRV